MSRWISSNGWNRIPKAIHVGLDVLSLTANDAIAHFNNGEKAALEIVRLILVIIWESLVDLKTTDPFIGCLNHRKTSEGAASLKKKAIR